MNTRETLRTFVMENVQLDEKINVGNLLKTGVIAAGVSTIVLGVKDIINKVQDGRLIKKDSVGTKIYRDLVKIMNEAEDLEDEIYTIEREVAKKLGDEVHMKRDVNAQTYSKLARLKKKATVLNKQYHDLDGKLKIRLAKIKAKQGV